MKTQKYSISVYVYIVAVMYMQPCLIFTIKFTVSLSNMFYVESQSQLEIVAHHCQFVILALVTLAFPYIHIQTFDVKANPSLATSAPLNYCCFHSRYLYSVPEILQISLKWKTKSNWIVRLKLERDAPCTRRQFPSLVEAFNEQFMALSENSSYCQIDMKLQA